eukprot:5800373-Heterocapsa_arctica.AAC.1
MKGERLDEQWRHWNEASEAYLGKVENKPSQGYKGRGKLVVSLNTIAATQYNSEGFAITAE